MFQKATLFITPLMPMIVVYPLPYQSHTVFSCPFCPMSLSFHVTHSHTFQVRLKQHTHTP